MSVMPSIVFAILVLAVVWLAASLAIARISAISPNRFTNVDIASWSFLLAPTVISYLVWMGMMVFPGKITLHGYLVGIPLLAVGVCVLLANQLGSFIGGLVREVRQFACDNGISKSGRWLCLSAVLFMACGIILWTNMVSSYKFDMSEYLLGGDYFARVRDIAYSGAVVDQHNGFWYHTYHSYCLPLFAAWGHFIWDVFGGKIDWYYRFIVLYYLVGLNFVAFAIFCRIRLDGVGRAMVLCAFAVLDGMPFAWCEVPLEFQCDFVRCSFITAIVFLLWRHLEWPQWNSCLVLGLLGSAAVGAHGTSVLFVGILFVSLLFARTKWRYRVLHICAIAAVVALTWGLHYVLQSVWGDGWLFPVAGEELASKPTDPWIARRFSGVLSLWLSGYLGQLFNVYHFGIYVVFVLIGAFLWLRRRERLSICHMAVLTAVLVDMVLIGKIFYFNFRYQYTFLPLLVIGSFAVIAMPDVSICRSSLRKWCCPFVIVYLIVSVFVMMDSCTSQKNRKSTALHLKRETSLISYIIGLVQNPTGLPPWPMKQGAPPKTCFCSVNKIPYRDAPYPTWYLNRDMTVFGAGERRIIQKRQLARIFDYFLLQDQMRPYVLAEGSDPEWREWREMEKSGVWTLYKSIYNSKVSGQGGVYVEQ